MIFSSYNLLAQQQLVELINEAKKRSLPDAYQPFTLLTSPQKDQIDTLFTAPSAVYRFSINTSQLDLLQKDNSSFIELDVPISNDSSFHLELIPFSIFGNNYTVKNSNNEPINVSLNARFYHGIIKNKPNSLVSISIIDGKMSGIISYENGNYNLGVEGNKSNYVLFNDQNIIKKPKFNCQADLLPGNPMNPALFNDRAKTKISTDNTCSKVIEVYLEVDSEFNAILRGERLDYIYSVFSMVSTIYKNDGVDIVISELKFWEKTDPYVKFATIQETYTAFAKTLGRNFTGHLAHLLSARNLGGGVAALDKLCDKSQAFGVNGNLGEFTPDLPIYSWNVSVITHEIGHNLGSPHTHSCSWPGGAIDGCAGTEGGCPAGPTPINGGTIMSYCHLSSIGINFANGFGPLPSALIRSRIDSCTLAPSQLSTTKIYRDRAVLNWSHIDKIFTVEYRAVSSNNWIQTITTSKQLKLLNLSPNTYYIWRVKTDCSDWVTTTFTTTNIPIDYCKLTHAVPCPLGVYIEKIQLYGTNLISDGCPTDGYNFTPSPIKNVLAGQPIPFTISLTNDTQPSYISIWIDLDQDYEFQENELLFVTNQPFTQTLSSTLTIPTETITGTTRLRVNFNLKEPKTASCGIFNSGETEDYNVEIVHCSNQLCLPFSIIRKK